MLLRYRTLTKKTITPEQDTFPSWVHPEYVYWHSEWKIVRDSIGGEKDIKDAGRSYLPQLEGMDDDDYYAYLDRATFYNFTGRTVNALTGTLFRRKIVVSGVPERLLPRLENVGKDSTSFTNFTKTTAYEMLSVGREGVLVDLPKTPTTDPQPYLVHYTAENILDWDDTSVQDPRTGRNVLSKVVLREFKRITKTDEKGHKTQVLAARYRELWLKPSPVPGQVFEYGQTVYESEDGDAEYGKTEQASTIRVTRRGAALDFIPFEFFGVLNSGSASVEKPPMIDIARLNVSHFRSYALLEHGRFYTGLPVYYVETQGDGQDEYTLGPSRIWLVSEGNKPGLLEFNGQGLKFLENALSHKEAHAASLGGRMIGITPQSTSESDNQTKLKERNEQSLLINTASGLDTGYTRVLRWYLWFADTPKEEADKAAVEFNKDFLYDAIGSREFRAIHAMYKDGVLPVEVVYDYLRKAEVIPDAMDLEEFTAKLRDLNSFPNQPDAEARAAGFTTKQQQIGAEDKDIELETEQQLADTLQQEADDAAKQARDAHKVALAAAKNPAPVAKPIAKPADKPVPKPQK